MNNVGYSGGTRHKLLLLTLADLMTNEKSNLVANCRIKLATNLGGPKLSCDMLQIIRVGQSSPGDGVTLGQNFILDYLKGTYFCEY